MSYSITNPVVTIINFSPTVVGGVARLAVTVYQNGVFDGETRHAELVQAAEVLWRIGHDVVTSNQLTGSVTDRNGVVTGVWVYTPTAVN